MLHDINFKKKSSLLAAAASTWRAAADMGDSSNPKWRRVAVRAVQIQETKVNGSAGKTILFYLLFFASNDFSNIFPTTNLVGEVQRNCLSIVVFVEPNLLLSLYFLSCCLH